MDTTDLIDGVRGDLRRFFSDKGISLPDSYPCPVPQRIAGKQDLNLYIDHTLLKQTSAAAEYDKLFAEARVWKPFSVCVPPARIPRAVRALDGSGVKTCSVVGFPWGYDSSAAKAADTAWLVDQGCDEIDMVISVGRLKDRDWLYVHEDVKAVVDAADGRLVKVILESAELSDEEIVAASLLSGWAGAWFIKTSTGFASGGASVRAVEIMRAVAGDVLGVKASGGIRNREFTEELIAAGADRIGASATGAILGLEAPAGGGY
jgi:deoxyribose-phosphate aldolase